MQEHADLAILQAACFTQKGNHESVCLSGGQLEQILAEGRISLMLTTDINVCLKMVSSQIKEGQIQPCNPILSAINVLCYR